MALRRWWREGRLVRGDCLPVGQSDQRRGKTDVDEDRRPRGNDSDDDWANGSGDALVLG